MIEKWKPEQVEDESCPSCEVIYNVTETRLPIRDAGSFSCQICGGLIKSWRGASYYSYKIKK